MYLNLNYNGRIRFADVNRALSKLIKAERRLLERGTTEFSWPFGSFNVDAYDHPDLAGVTFHITIPLGCDFDHILIKWTTPDGRTHTQRVWLTFVPSNLGQGMVGYFVCPITGKRCRVLYTDGRAVCSRFAIPGSVYPYQNQSHRNQKISQYHRYGEDKQEQLRNRRLWYRGEPTRHGKRLVAVAEKHEALEAEVWGDFFGKFASFGK